jgi:7-dehydrocholesterol reductase
MQGVVSWILTGQGERERPPAPALTPLEASFTRRVLGPALLIFATPPLVIVFWMICAHYDGSIVRFVTTVDAGAFVRLFPRPTLAAAQILGFWILFQGLLLALLPGKTHLGPVTPTGKQPRYKLNGVPAWFVTHVGLFLAWRLGWWSPSTVYRELGAILLLLCLFALVFCAFLYWKGRSYPTTTDAVYTGHFLFDFFQGVELHPTLFGVNLKQLCNCRLSMMGWSVLLCCYAGYQYESHGFVANSMIVSAGLVVAYLFKFFVWEGGYFNSLDIMHDRFGYYICWGVLVWVPSVYTIFGQYFANHPIQLHPVWSAAIFLLGLCALWMNYAADAQRQRVRATRGQTTVWGRPPRTLTARYTTTDGETRENLLLVSGYWGLARHFHYVPELTLALCWALPAGTRAFLPYFYFVFLTILLVDRANRDDQRCAKKYGATWDEYRRLVPYKILPGVY